MSGKSHSSWRGGLLDCGAHAAMYCGEFSRTDVHSHYAIQLIDCPAGFSMNIGERSHTELRTALIGSGIPHELTSAGSGTFLFLAPHSGHGRRLRTLLAPAGGRGSLVVQAGEERTGHLLSCWTPRHDVGDPTVADEIVGWIGEQVRVAPQASLTLADVCGRFNRSDAAVSRVLRVDLGVNFTSIVRWERLRMAVELIAGGASCTEAAHEAGFYDGSHFTRVCKAMFGIPPKLLELGCVKPAAGQAVSAALRLREVC